MPSIDAECLFYKIEDKKKELGLTRLRAPRVLKRISQWNRVNVSSEELLRMGYYIPLASSPLRPMGRIFERLRSIQVTKVADSIEKLRNTDEDVRDWLATIDESLFEVVRGKNCPPLFTLQKPTLLHGHIPDGNHRAIAAARLILQGENVSLPAFEGVLSPQLFLAINVYYLFLGLKRNRTLTTDVFRQRYGNM